MNLSTAPNYGGSGGAWLPMGLPTPVFNIALATNTANYVSNGAVNAVPFSFPDGYLDQANLLVQKEYKGNVVTVGWVGEFGHHLGSSFVGTAGAAFGSPTPGTIGNARPMHLFGLKLTRTDFSIFKDFSLTEV